MSPIFSLQQVTAVVLDLDDENLNSLSIQKQDHHMTFGK